MTKTSDIPSERPEVDPTGMVSAASKANAWFVREVLPLENLLLKFLRRGWRNESDVRDLCQDVYVGVYAAAQVEIPVYAKAFVFAVARNILVERIRREQIVSIEAVADLEELGLATDEPGPDKSAIARQELRRLQAALDRMPKRWREAVVMRKVQGMSRPEIALRLGIAEATVSQHLAAGMAALATLFHDDADDQRGHS
ncbi:MAG TPA: sigma-70 family RNA polymerase sigma factor [Rhizomicrobium sp.]|nr:sigma-70 family RNA polymerase sigma factor [Rhizomicrobium sp.]